MASISPLKLAEGGLDCSPGSFLCSLAPGARKAFAALAYIGTYPQGTTLFEAEESPKGIFVVLKGRVKISMSSAEGKIVILRIANPGEVVGIHAVLVGSPYEASAETLEPTQISFMKRDTLRSFLHEYPDAALEIARELGHDYHIACEQVRALVLLHSAPKKLARFFLEWASRGQHAKDGIRAKLPLTHEEIGQIIGISRETVTRTLSDFRNQRLVRTTGSTLIIPDPAALAQVAQAC